jgi:hypothetical protein
MELKIYSGTFRGERAVIATANPLPDGFTPSKAKPSPQAAEIAAAFPDVVFVNTGPLGSYQRAQPGNVAGQPPEKL